MEVKVLQSCPNQRHFPGVLEAAVELVRCPWGVKRIDIAVQHEFKKVRSANGVLVHRSAISGVYRF